jgi:L-amino acid N-acyltransferase YncA
MIRSAAPEDSAPIAALYNHFVERTVVTFEEKPIDAREMRSRIAAVIGTGYPWLVIEADGRVVGYAYAKPWQTRSAYRRTLESTIYLAPDFARRGLGTQLYGALIDELRKARLAHCVVGGIALPNPGSIKLHEKLGFQLVGIFKEAGWKFDNWVDVGYWQLML